MTTDNTCICTSYLAVQYRHWRRRDNETVSNNGSIVCGLCIAAKLCPTQASVESNLSVKYCDFKMPKVDQDNGRSFYGEKKRPF